MITILWSITSILLIIFALIFYYYVGVQELNELYSTMCDEAIDTFTRAADIQSAYPHAIRMYVITIPKQEEIDNE